MTKNINDEELFRKVIKITYNNRVSLIKTTLGNKEKEYLKNNDSNKLMNNKTFEELIVEYKENIKNANNKEVGYIIHNLNSLLSDSNSLFKEKIKSDGYMTTPHNSFIYPIIEEKLVKKYYNGDISILNNNPELGKKLNREIDTYLIANAIFNIMYVNNNTLPENKENILFDGCTSKDILDFVKENNLTIGMYLDSITNLKFDIRRNVINNIKDKQLKAGYLRGISDAREVQLKNNKKLSTYNCGMFYFITHTETNLIADMCTNEKRLTK